MPNLRQLNTNSTRGQKSYKRTPVTAYYRSAETPGKTSPFKKKPPRKNRRKLLFGIIDILLIVLLVIGLVYSLILKPEPRIKASDLSYRPIAAYSAKITPEFNSLHNRNKITFDETAVAAAIEKQFPEIQAVRVELPFFSQQPTVWLNVAPPAFKLQSGGSSYIVDSQGIVTAKAAELPKLNKLVSLSDQSGFETGVGKQVLSAAAVNFIDTVIAQARHAGVPISGLSLPPLAQEMDLRTADTPYFVKFYMGGDALTQTGQFLASRKNFLQNPSQAPHEYLDVRVSGKIFYK
jgi:cell division septal protein FtsQ